MSFKRRVVLGCAALLAAASWPAAAQTPPPCPQYSFSRAFTNLTGKTVQGLHLSIHGPKSVDGFHTGPDNPFGEPVFHGLGPDGTYRVRFGGASVSAGQTVRVAFCIDAPASEMVPLGSSFAQSWFTTDGGEDEEPAPEQRLPAVGAVWAPQAGGPGSFQVRVELTNSEEAEVQLTSLQWTRLDQPLSPGEMAWEHLDSVATWQALGSAAILPAAPHEAGSSRTAFTLPAGFQFDEPGVLLFRFVAGEPGSESNLVRGVGQVAIASLLRPVFLESRALEVAAGRLGAPAPALSVYNSTRAEYPLQGTTAYPFKVGDAAGNTVEVVLGASGNELDSLQLQNEERALHTALYGRLEPALAGRLATASPEALIPVALWLEAPADTGAPAPPDSDVPLTQEQVQAFYDQVDAHLAARAAALAAPVVSRLQALGYAARSAAYTPVVYASLPPSGIAQAAQWAEVDTIYGTPTLEPLMDVAGPVVRADLLHALGVDGTNVKLGLVEIDTPQFLNPYLNRVVQGTHACMNTHPTAVAGIIVSTHPTYKGIAPGATLYAGSHCSAQGQDIADASDDTFAWGATALNLSLGADDGTMNVSAFDRFYDDAVRNRRRIVVVAAGNEASPCATSAHVTMPARGYNILTIGNYEDRGTKGWLDDRMNGCSSYVDPTSTHGDREKPEITAPGTTIRGTTTASPWTGNNGFGTSYSAPVVTGAAGLLFQRNGTLATQPEALKAILMNTAIHNIEGDDRLSEKDGAGGIVLDHALATLDNSRWGRDNNYLCNAASPKDVQTITLGGGRRTRVTLVWSTSETYADYVNRPGADLDLQVIGPAGNVVASSASWDNTYEIVDFLAPANGNYKIRVIKYRCNDDPKHLAWAWWQADETIVDGAGWDAQGAGIDILDINGNGAPEMFLMAYDAPPGQNNFRYKIGWDIDNLGRTSNWTGIVQENGVGWEGQGASLNLVNLDTNSRPEMVLMAYDNPPGANTFRYKIGWNLTTAGTTAVWTGPIQVGGVGWEGQGAGVELANLDANPRPEMILMAYDNPPGGNTFRYLIGWNLNALGIATAWTGPVQIPGAGWEGQGAGVTIANLDGNALPDMLLMAYDNPPGANTFRYKVGWNLNAAGIAASWSNLTQIDGIGWEADGADPRLFDIDADGIQELFLMCYDDPWGPNTFRYRVIEP